MRKVNTAAVMLAYKDFQQNIETYYNMPTDTLIGKDRLSINMIPKHIFRYFLHQTCKIAGIKQEWCAAFCKVDRGGTLVASSKLVYIMIEELKNETFNYHFDIISMLWWQTIKGYDEIDAQRLSKYINLF